MFQESLLRKSNKLHTLRSWAKETLEYFQVIWFGWNSNEVIDVLFVFFIKTIFSADMFNNITELLETFPSLLTRSADITVEQLISMNFPPEREHTIKY